MKIGTFNTSFGGSIFIQEETKKDKENLAEKLLFVVSFLKLKGYKPFKHFEINPKNLSVYKENWTEIKFLVKELNVVLQK